MLLAIDIGNTNITFGLFKGKRLEREFNIPTRDFSKKKLIAHLGSLSVTGAIICSVVPAVTRELDSVLRRTGISPVIIGKDAAVPIKNLYRRPQQVGQDRLVNAYAAAEVYSAPALIVDFGTAVTFDVVSKNHEYLGGVILPGLKISLEALAEKTALLPKLKLSAPFEFIGRDTKSSMLSGLVFGMASLTDAWIEKIKRKIGKKTLVIGTGGDIGLMRRYCSGFDRIDQHLTLKGLSLIYRDLFVVNKKITSAQEHKSTR